MPSDEKDVAPPPGLSSKVGGRVEAVHIDLFSLAKPTRDQGDHDRETGSDENDKDSTDVQAHVIILKENYPACHLLGGTVTVTVSDWVYQLSIPRGERDGHRPTVNDALSRVLCSLSCL